MQGILGIAAYIDQLINYLSPLRLPTQAGYLITSKTTGTQKSNLSPHISWLCTWDFISAGNVYIYVDEVPSNIEPKKAVIPLICWFIDKIAAYSNEKNTKGKKYV